jgi:hypothetical protein
MCIVCLSSGFAVAQEQDDNEGSLFATTIMIQRVYPHSLGYEVVYNKSDLYPAVAYLPGRWFTGAAGKGEIIYTQDDSVPYMNVFYRDGEFSHVRLYVHSNRMHTSWGVARSGRDMDDEFSSDTLELEY